MHPFSTSSYTFNKRCNTDLILTMQEGNNVRRNSRVHTQRRSLSPRKGSHSRTHRNPLLRSSTASSCDSHKSSKGYNKKRSKRRRIAENSIGGIKRDRLPTFDGVEKTRLEAKAWLLGMEMYLDS